MLQEVTVVRGPVSNIYGSGAIGGVVVFETKDPDDFLRQDERVAGSLTTRYETNGDGVTASARSCSGRLSSPRFRLRRVKSVAASIDGACVVRSR